MVKKNVFSKIIVMLVVMTMVVSYISPMQTAYAENLEVLGKGEHGNNGTVKAMIHVADENNNNVEGATISLTVKKVNGQIEVLGADEDKKGKYTVNLSREYESIIQVEVTKPGYTTYKNVYNHGVSPNNFNAHATISSIDYTVKFYNALDEVISTQTLKYNESAVEPIDKPSKDGYEFKGWNTDEWKQVQKNLDVKPEFKQIQYTVTFDLDGGKINDSTASIEKKVNQNDTVEQPLDPTKDGKKFEGWIIKETTTAFDFSTKIVANTQLKATYSDVEPEKPVTPETPVTEVNAKLYVLMPKTTRPNDVTGKVVGRPDANYLQVGTSKYSRDFTEVQFAETDDSSYVEDRMSQIVNNNKVKDGVISVEKNGYLYTAQFDLVDFYAVKCAYTPAHIDGEATWSEPTIINYNIVYKLGYDTAENDQDNPTSYNVESDDIVLKDAKLYGYEFKGWYTNKDFADNTKVTKIAKGSTGNKTLYAKFTPAEYTITYNNVENATNPNTKNKYTVEESYTFQDASKNNYRFDGWYDKDNNKVTQISENQTGDIVLYAKWTLVNSIVSINFKYADSVSGDNLPQLPKAIEDNYTVGAPYNYTIPKLYGFVATHTSITGTANSEKIEYTVTYSNENTKNATVNYYYSNKGTEPIKTEIVKLFESEIDENSVADLILERIGGVNSQKTDNYLDGKANFNFETLTMNIVYDPIIIISGVEDDDNDDTIIDDEETPGGDIKDESSESEDNKDEDNNDDEDLTIDDEETPGGDIKDNQNQESVSDASQDGEKSNEQIGDEPVPGGTAKLPNTAGMLPQVLCGFGALAVIFGIVLKKKDK